MNMKNLKTAISVTWPVLVRRHKSHLEPYQARQWGLGPKELEGHLRERWHEGVLTMQTMDTHSCHAKGENNPHMSSTF
jgi:hypothetical protein